MNKKIKFVMLFLIEIFIVTGCQLNNQDPIKEKDDIIITDFPCYTTSVETYFYEKDNNIYMLGYAPNINVFLKNESYDLIEAMKMGIITLEDLDNYNYSVIDNSSGEYQISYLDKDTYNNIEKYDTSNIEDKIMLKNTDCSDILSKKYFYEDENYKYYSTATITVYYNNKEYTLSEAIEESIISLHQLKEVNFDYQKEEK